MPSADITEFRRALASSQKIIVLSGAGLSAASGIATFRGTGGRWGKYNASDVATPAAFAESQSKVWQFFHYRREEMRDKKPNEAHYVLARLAIPSIRHAIAPGSTLTHITQNIDTLCTRALAETETTLRLTHPEPPSEIIEMHGRIFDVACTSTHDCDYHATNLDSPICPGLAGTEIQVAAEELDARVKRKDLPTCPRPGCGAMLRPDVVWFGERPKRIEDILALADDADLCLVVGTSALVQPASKIGGQVKNHGGKVAVFNVEGSTNHADEADFLFVGPCEVTLGEVLGI
ncbi:DHS-like NAD/FAD-binding domain-containing protein [Hygrophoropsis aurantiaca]|uniref:DHS-like NAD/FAD-binding domain-containing protein n=1 Tax=Hygrophoropsis aurantiaca TaxID=72124 RepID=A0ACB8A9S2_9AGAM|nr:DHS-like NAD/FAD-binding domain-containing protein [Hygrophoropsis aurantiaca]